jgi:succinate dehydrogenase/fumarate reductase cytochrome b subunit
VGTRALGASQVDCLLISFVAVHHFVDGIEVAMDFDEKDDSLMDIVCKVLIIFTVILLAFLINWIIQKT